MIQHASPISGIATHGDEYVATAGYDNQVILWNARTRRPLARGNHDHLANYCEFSACGRFLVTASSDHTARIWRVPDLELLQVLGSHGDDVEAVAVHPEGLFVATACFDQKIRVYGFDGRLLQTLVGHEDEVLSVAWLKGTACSLVSSSDDGTVRRWNAATGAQEKAYDLGDMETDAISVGAGGIIYAGNDDGDLFVLDEERLEQISAHKAGIKTLSISKDGSMLLSSSYDRFVKLWSLAEPGRPRLVLSSEFPAIVWPRCAAFSGRDIVFGSFGTTYAVFDYQRDHWQTDHISNTDGINYVLPTPRGVFTIGDAGVMKRDGIPVSEVGSLCNFLVEAGDRLYTGGQLGAVLDAATGKTIYQSRSPLNCAVAYVAGGRQKMLVGSYTGQAIEFVVDATGHAVFEREVVLHKNAIKGFAVSGNRLFAVCSTGDVGYYDIETLETLQIQTKGHSKVANACVALANGAFATVSRDKNLVLWEGDGRRTVPTPHTHSIKCVAATEDGTLLATGAYNGRIEVFHLPSGSWVHAERPTTAGISSLAYDRQRRTFFASSYDGRCYTIPLSILSAASAAAKERAQ